MQQEKLEIPMPRAVEKWEEAFGKKMKKPPKCWWAASVTNSLLRGATGKED